MRVSSLIFTVSFRGLLLILWIGLFCSCAQIPIKDETIFGVRYPPGNGAVSVHTITGPIVDLSEDDWLAEQTAINTENEALMCMSSNSFADFKSEIEQLCSMGNYCAYSDVQSMRQFFLKLEKVKHTLKAHKH